MTRAFLLLTLMAGGCGLNLKLVDASVKKPSNVAVYFNVTDAHHVGVPNLTADQFHVYEDDKLVSPSSRSRPS